MASKRTPGFTLIELMIVVAIIAIILAVAIPNLLRARLQANESSAIEALRAVLLAQVAYFNGNHVYATTFAPLISDSPPYLPPGSDGDKDGYQFSIGGTGSSFWARATPITFGHTGNRGFYIDAGGTIRYAIGVEANDDSPVLGDEV